MLPVEEGVCVLPIQDVSGYNAVRSTEPGTELGEEDIGTNSQQQSLLLYKPITAPRERQGGGERIRPLLG